MNQVSAQNEILQVSFSVSLYERETFRRLSYPDQVIALQVTDILRAGPFRAETALVRRSLSDHRTFNNDVLF